ncbi:MAG: VCBS repeat-containing protein, partial [Thermoleophilia bacterium]
MRSRSAALVCAIFLMLILAAVVGAARADAVVFLPATDYGTGTWPASVAVGDFNNDGKQDLATADYGSNAVSVLLGNGNGGFGAKTDFGTGAYPEPIAVADFNADGKQDLATASESTSAVSVLLGNGKGGFGAKTDFGLGTSTSPLSIA